MTEWSSNFLLEERKSSTTERKAIVRYSSLVLYKTEPVKKLLRSHKNEGSYRVSCFTGSKLPRKQETEGTCRAGSSFPAQNEGGPEKFMH